MSNQFTWADLLAFAQQLTEEDLKEKVIVWRESESIEVSFAEQLDEDFYNNPDDDYCVRESEYKEFYNEDPKECEATMAYRKGFPVMVENF